MLPATRDPGQEPALQGPFAPRPVGSKEGDPCSPAYPKSTLPEGCKHSKISFLSLSPCLTALGSILRSHPSIEAMLGAGALRCWPFGVPHESSYMLCSRRRVTRDCLCPVLPHHPRGRQGFPSSWRNSTYLGTWPWPPALVAVNLGEQEASDTARCFPAANQPRWLWHSPSPLAQGCQHQ